MVTFVGGRARPGLHDVDWLKATVVDIRHRPQRWPEVMATARAQAELAAFLAGAAEHQDHGLAVAIMDARGRIRRQAVHTLGDVATQTVVVGRHPSVDAHLGAPDFALRQALIVQTARRPDVIKYVDLRAAAGTSTVDGHPIESATLTLPVVLQVGGMVIIIAGTPMPLLSTTAFIGSTTAPQPAAEFSSPPELFRYRLQWPDAVTEFRPGATTLAKGVLIGRHRRCDFPRRVGMEMPGLSRIHAVILTIDGEPYLADAGTTNGTEHEALGEMRIKHLEAGDVFLLGEKLRLSVHPPA
ncbi:MAG: FHA domain-containing protein [Deltaproteobacteria bacterium]|nr:FHA domain-containing protein [Deltaproteobacteria bacterium]